jgi:hypothetical protein
MAQSTAVRAGPFHLLPRNCGGPSTPLGSPRPQQGEEKTPLANSRKQADGGGFQMAPERLP